MVGPVVDEYYSGTEAMGATFLRGAEWIEHPGSVGRAVCGVVHITDDGGVELGVEETGWVWFESDGVFEYHNDPDKTAAAHDRRGWSKLGDLDHLAGYECPRSVDFIESMPRQESGKLASPRRQYLGS